VTGARFFGPCQKKVARPQSCGDLYGGNRVPILGRNLMLGRRLNAQSCLGYSWKPAHQSSTTLTFSNVGPFGLS